MSYNSKSTARQREAQHLFQGRGLLERTRANVRSVLNEYALDSIDKSALHTTEIILDHLISQNIRAFSTISSRIPPDLKLPPEGVDTLP